MNATELLVFNSECFLRVVDGELIISNPKLRHHVKIDVKTAGLIFEHANGLCDAEWRKHLVECSGWDRTERFMGVQGLVTDPSGLRAHSQISPAEVSGDALFKLLRFRLVLIEDLGESQRKIAPMINSLDQEHLGSFHQRVGQYVLLGLREREPWRAWQNQKFTSDGLKLIGENYRQIQEPFFERRFNRQTINGLRVLDFGCGNGYFSAKFSRAGAQVTALDSSEELMALARKNYCECPGIQFVVAKSFRESITYLEQLDAGSLDLIYLQDTLLLLINPENGVASNELSELLAAFRRVLSQKGELCAMEPNAIFWLAGRYGSQAKPYAVVTEYRHPVFNVVPTLGEMLKPLAEAGFALIEYCHPEHTDKTHIDYRYAEEFPIWDFLKFKVLNR
jgi:SAM-dependent methyltransferase